MSFNGVAYLMKVYAFGQAGIPLCAAWWRARRSCANFKFEVADVNNAIPIDFSRKMRFFGIWSSMLW